MKSLRKGTIKWPGHLIRNSTMKSTHKTLRRRLKPVFRNASKLMRKLSKTKGNPKAGILSKHLENAVGSSGSGGISVRHPTVDQ